MFLQLIPWWLRNSNQNKKSEIKEIRSQMYLSFALASFHQNDIGTLTAKIYYDILWYMVYYTYYMIHTYISIKIYIHMTHIHDYIPYDISRYIMIYNDIGPFTANLCICLLRQFHQITSNWPLHCRMYLLIAIACFLHQYSDFYSVTQLSMVQLLIIGLSTVIL